MSKGFSIQLNDSNSPGELFDVKSSIKLDESNKIITGFSFGDVVPQNTALILIATPGELKHAPTIGVSLDDSVLDDELLSLRHLARRSFSLDGMKVEKLELYDLKNIDIKTKY